MFNYIYITKNHLMIILIFALFMYISPKLTKNILPHSYLIEKILCFLLVLILLIDQIHTYKCGDYDVNKTLPLTINYVSMYLCIFILIFKKYNLFNIFFSWSIVSTIGEVLMYKHDSGVILDTKSIVFVISKCLILYSIIYMIEVRKFKINEFAILENFIACILYFGGLYFLNWFTTADYSYAFFDYNKLSIIVFTIITTFIYIPASIFGEIDIFYKTKKK